MDRAISVRVFISYSHDSATHKQRVLELAQQLRAHGVDAQCDQFVNGSPEQGWPRWMEGEIADAKYVLVVCTPRYRVRFDARDESREGKGVAWESIVARQELYDRKGKLRKYIPVLLDESEPDCVPAILSQFTVYRLMEQYTDLLRVLLDQPSVVPVSLAAPPRLAPGAAVSSLVANLPLPLAQMLVRSLNAKTPADACLAATHFCEVMLRLCAASYASLYLHSGRGSAAIDRKLEALECTDPGRCIQLLTSLAEFFSARPPVGTSDFFGGAPQRLVRPVSWSNAVSTLAPDGAGSSTPPGSLSPLGALAALPGARQPDGVTDDGAGDKAAALRNALIEIYTVLNPFGENRLAMGTFEARDGGEFAYRYLALQGDGIRLPLAPGSAPQKAADQRESVAWWIGRGEPLPLSPFVVCQAAPAGQERIGFLHIATLHAAAPDTDDGGAVRKLVYLDYQSGEFLDHVDAASEVAALLTTLAGRTVSPAEVRATSELEWAAPDSNGTARGNWLGDFELLGELGHGAMGIVYKARQGSLGRIVALKVLPPRLASDPLAVRRFAVEVETLGRCDHPNIVKVLTAGQEGDSRYYAMEFVEGSDLAGVFSVLSQWKQSEPGHLTEGHLLAALSSLGNRSGAGSKSTGPALAEQPVVEKIEPDRETIRHFANGRDYFRRLAEIMADAARAVQYLHDHGILHRDLKPGNLMLTADGHRAIVMDLGLAKFADQQSIAGSSQVKILGTLRYMAPEQLQRKLIHITGQADVYGLGATLYELACLSPIFDGDTEERLTAQVLFEEPVKPRLRAKDLPAALELIIQKATAKQPQNRYKTAGQLAEDLDSFARGGFTIHAKPPTVEQRARQYVVRHKGKVSGLAAAVLLAAGTLWTWDFNRVKTEHYANLVGQRGIVRGVGRLTRRQWERMDSHTELLYRRGKLIVSKLVNSAGTLQGIESRYSYRQDGSLEKIEEFDRNGILQRIERVNEDATIATFEDESGAAATSTYEENGETRATEIERLKIDYDAKGNIARVFYQNRFGQPKPNHIGVYGLLYERSPEGFVRASWNLGVDGQKTVGINGIFKEAWQVDNWGYPMRDCLFDRDGHPAANRNNVSCSIYERDDVGNPTRVSYVDTVGNRVTSTSSGCAGYAYQYDRHGFEIEWRCLDRNGNATANNDGVAIGRRTYDARGNISEDRGLDAEGRPTYTKQGISISKRRYDTVGNEIEAAYFGVNGNPVSDEHGHHRVTNQYAGGRWVRWAQYDTSGRPVETSKGMPSTEYVYDAAGHRTDERYFGLDEKPAADSRGVHDMHWTYDERGNGVELSYTDVSGALVAVLPERAAVIAKKFDGVGNVIETAYFGPKREPILTPNGNHGWSASFNAIGQETERAFFGTGYEPVLYHREFQRYKLQWNALNKLTEVEYFGADGSPAASDGVHRWVRTYDSRGNQTESAFFGVDGEPVISRSRYQRQVSKYDEWDRLVEESYFGINNEPLVNANGVHLVTWRYDPRGDITEIAYFDGSGKACNSSQGFHRLTREYDLRGFQIDEQYYAPDGSPALHKDGHHRRVSVFDERGNRTEDRFYDAAGRLVLSDGRAIVKDVFDVRGNLTEVSYYGPDQQLIRRLPNHPPDPTIDADGKRRFGVARAVYKFDDANRKILEQFFGPDGKPAEDIYGVAKVEFTYGGSGAPVERWTNQHGAAVAVKNLEPPQR